MPTPLKPGTHIAISHSSYPAYFSMPSMDIATDHYNIGFTICGDRKTITPTCSFSYHAGDVTLLPPYIHHRTTFQSDAPYEKIMIKYSPDFVEPFIKQVGRKAFDYLNETKVFHFSLENQTKIHQLFLDMLEVYNRGEAYCEFILQGMLFRLFTFILEEHLCTSPKEIEYINVTFPIMTAITYMETFYSQNPSLIETAKVCGLSSGYFSRLFHEQLNQTYSSYLNAIKLKHATALLINTRKTITEIALETGFCHGNYFSEQFKKRYGMSPKTFRHTKSFSYPI